jgi:hypothetical protein
VKTSFEKVKEGCWLLDNIWNKNINFAASRGWIFSPKTDICVFWLPVAVAYICSFIFGALQEPPAISSINFLFGLAIFDAGHVLATTGPVFRRKSEGKLFAFRLGLILMTLFTLGSYLISRQLFFSIVAPLAVFHVMKQQYGWLMLSRRTFAEPLSTRLWDQVLLWNVMLAPVLWWLSPMSAAEKSYYMPKDFSFIVPSFVAQGALVLYVFINVAYVIHIFRSKDALNWGKLSLLMATGLWFFTLIFFPSKIAFFASLFYAHGIAYILYSQRDFAATQFTKMKGKWVPFVQIFAKKSLLFFIVVAAIGFVWRVGGTVAYKTFDVSSGSLIEFALWYPLLVHYYFDSFIWRGIDLELIP